MKNFSIAFVSVVLLLITFLYSSVERSSEVPLPPEADTPSRLAQKMAPVESFEMRRAYPDATIDLAAFESAMESARTFRPAKTAATASIGTTPWTMEGPTNIGGRINAIAQDPNDANTLLSGSVVGGIFKTTDDGASWEPVFDGNSYLSVSEITYQPGSSQIVYVGTGDRNITGFPFVGDGIYKSTDGGDTWTSLGLQDARIISRIIIDPNDTNRIYVAAMGLPMQRNNDRGIYRSTDGGQSWTQELFVSDETGAIDMLMDPSNSQILYATTWDRIRSGTESVVSGPNAGVWKSTDGGDNWSKLTNGLPTQTMSRVSISIDATNSNRLLATFVDPGSFQVFNMYQSLDAGQSWSIFPTTTLNSNALGGFGWYFANTFINPFSPNDVYINGVGLHHTSDNGATWQEIDGPSVHADKHDMLFTGPGSFILATDGGLYRTSNNGASWTDYDEIPNSQFYRVMPSPHEPGVYYGGMQDNGTARGNAQTIDQWERIFGGDGFQPLFTFNPSDIVALFQNGGMFYSDDFAVNWFFLGNGIDPQDRTNWDQPIIVSQHNSDVFYTGTYRLYQNTTGLVNHQWNPISGDLTDGVVIAPRFHNITAIAESPLSANILYTGSSDGNVHVSTNTGQSFSNVSLGLPDRYVTSIKASPFQTGEVLVTLSGYKNNSNTPHLLRSTDFGSSWIDVSGDLPQLALNDVLFHPVHDSIWVVGSDGGVYATQNSGVNWTRVGSNMPQIPIYDMEWDLPGSKLIVGTHARSMQSFPIDSLVPDVIIGVDRPVSAPSITVYPNPASHQITLAWGQELGRWTIYDIQGRRIRGGQLEGHPVKIPVEGLEAGTYIVLSQNRFGEESALRFQKN